MPNSTTSSSATSDYNILATDSQIWDSLKQAIANSSGFQRWEMEHPNEAKVEDISLDRRVSSYLGETLETLAY